MIGRMNGGDDIAPNNEYGAMYGGAFIFDIGSMETVSGTSWGTNTNSAEAGSAIQSIMNCSGHAFIGTYSSDFTWWVPDQRSSCMAGNGSFNVPPMPGFKTIINGGAGYADWNGGFGGPAQLLAVSGGTFGQTYMSQAGVSGSSWGVSNYNMGMVSVSVTSPANQSIVHGIPSQYWIFPGLAVRDLTTPAAIPDGTYVSRLIYPDALLLDHNLAQPIPVHDQLQFFTPSSSSGPCITMSPAFNDAWGMTFDFACNTGGVSFSYNGNSGMWGWGYGHGSIAVGFPWGAYKGGQSGGVVFPSGFLLGGAVTSNPIYERNINYDFQGPVNYHTSGLTALQPFVYTINQKLILSACDYPLTASYTGILDTSLSGNPVIGFTSSPYGCSLTPVLVLAANSTQTSAANMDVLTIGSVTVNAADFFSTSNPAFPIADCTGVTAGATVKDTAIAGSPSIGTVSSCVSQNVLTLTSPVQAGSAGPTDTLLATANLPGNLILNVSPTTTVGSVEKYVGPPSGAGANDTTYPYPFGQISGDTSGITWPGGTVVYTNSLPVCDGSHFIGYNAVIYDGIPSPTYLQAAVGGGSSIRKVFCDGTGWLYD